MFKTFIRQVLTGPDNETLAWGRVMGAVVFLVFVVGVPIACLALLIIKLVPIDDLVKFLDALAFYLPTSALAAWSFVTATGFFEPKRRPPDQQ